MKIHLATDHAGYALKEYIKGILIEEGHEVIDHGADVVDASDDYPDFVIPAAQAVVMEGNDSFAFVFGGSGTGEAIAANRIPRVRAAVYYGGNLDIVRLAREHNNANVLSIGARFVSEQEAEAAVITFLATPFSGDERHVRRINKIG